MRTILVIEDEADIADLVAFNLKRAGHHVEVEHDGEAGLARAREILPDLIVLDLMLPKLNGVGVFMRLREKKKTRSIPVIMLSARAQPEDRVAGLEMGADDYLAKPFSPKELVLRAGNLLRRAAVPADASEAEPPLVAGPFLFDRATLTCELDGAPLELTSTEFKLLLRLCKKAGQPQDRATLLRKVWGYRDDTHSRTLDTHIKRLRKKLGSHAHLLETERGTGYKMRFE